MRCEQRRMKANERTFVGGLHRGQDLRAIVHMLANAIPPTHPSLPTESLLWGTIPGPSLEGPSPP
eukprot:3899916-Amphidinium_carterae.1